MLCSESELGLAEVSNGIMELPNDAPIGIDLREYLQLNDKIFDLDLTPNRGDCLSLLGIAREVAAINKLSLHKPSMTPVTATVAEQLPVKIASREGCWHYLGRIIRQINPKAQTPLWMQEKLRRSGIGPLYLTVDVTNYVLLELGQPLHAFDLDHIKEGIEVRFAKDHEKILLLDNQELKLSCEDLVISDGTSPVALAGIKGGSKSGISVNTKDIFLESALFNPTLISKTARRYGLYTDSSARFERGVDFMLQRKAIDRASSLILQLAGGEAGEITEVGEQLPPKSPIELRKTRILKILGIQITDDEVKDILQRLGMQVSMLEKGWQVIPPSYRYDVNCEIDLIEELIRIYGYSHIPGRKLTAPLDFLAVPEKKLNLGRIRNLLVDSGYQEAITYSFVDPVYEEKLCLQKHPIRLLNPISADLSTMRTNHWPGLIKAFKYNDDRQQSRVRLFEIGLCFQNKPDKLEQELKLGGLCSGLLYNEQWGESKRLIDFYDVKGDVEKILTLNKKEGQVSFAKCEHPALHPGKSASILLDQQSIGLLGELHPGIAQQLDIYQTLYLFDLDLDTIMDLPLPVYKTISKFPAIRRDLAIVVTTNVPAEEIRQKILELGEDLLKNVQIFDIYQGKSIEAGKKSIALSLTFQHISRTLVDGEINEFMQNIIKILHKEFNATLRD